MKTWQLRRGRNMSRIDFGWCFFENVKELLLSMFLHVWARACLRNLYSYVRNSVLAYAGMFLRLYIRRNGPAYARSCLHAWALARVRDVRQKPCSAHFYSFLTVSLLYAILTHILVIFASNYHCIILFIFILALKHHISWISLESWI